METVVEMNQEVILDNHGYDNIVIEPAQNVEIVINNWWWLRRIYIEFSLYFISTLII